MKVIKRTELPIRLPIWESVVVWLVMDNYDIGIWAHVATTAVVLWWLFVLALLVIEEETNVL